VSGDVVVAVVLAGIILVTLMLAIPVFASRYRRAGPNEALVIFGRQRQPSAPGRQTRDGYRIVTAGGTFILPILEWADEISLEAIALPFDVTAHFLDGQRARFTGSATVAVDRDEESIYLASTRLQSKTPDDIAALASPILTTEIHARVATKTIDEIPRAPICFATDIAEAFNARLSEFGLICLSVDLKNAEPL